MRKWQLVGKMSTAGDPCVRLIEPTPFRVGRRPEASLTVPRSTVSGLHAELFSVEERLFVRDLGSTNGTFVNGERVGSVIELKEDDVIQFADVSFRVEYCLPKSDSYTMAENCNDHALARMQFDRLLREEAVIPYFQPIVDLQTGQTTAFEVLARSRLVGLETPGRMFAIASDLMMEARLSDLMRRKGIESCSDFQKTPPVYLNTHPSEFDKDTNWDWIARLRESAPSQRLVIEVHEAAVTDAIGIAQFRGMLCDYDIGLAFDDFGAGQARIAELSAVRPDCLKFDRRMITGLDLADTSRQRFIRGLVDAIRDIGVTPLAEGIETAGEQQICQEMGFELGQGYHLGMPRPVEDYKQWAPPRSVPVEAVAQLV